MLRTSIAEIIAHRGRDRPLHCATKRRHSSRREAVMHIRSLEASGRCYGRETLSPYWCRHHFAWHVGHFRLEPSD